MNNEKNRNEIIEAKNELINLYLLIKPKKVDDVLLLFIFLVKTKFIR
jgi:hypothetical protein